VLAACLHRIRTPAQPSTSTPNLATLLLSALPDPATFGPHASRSRARPDPSPAAAARARTDEHRKDVRPAASGLAPCPRVEAAHWLSALQMMSWFGCASVHHARRHAARLAAGPVRSMPARPCALPGDAWPASATPAGPELAVASCYLDALKVWTARLQAALKWTPAHRPSVQPLLGGPRRLHLSL
jgi:hypothetical protein